MAKLTGGLNAGCFLRLLTSRLMPKTAASAWRKFGKATSPSDPKLPLNVADGHPESGPSPKAVIDHPRGERRFNFEI